MTFELENPTETLQIIKPIQKWQIIYPVFFLLASDYLLTPWRPNNKVSIDRQQNQNYLDNPIWLFAVIRLVHFLSLNGDKKTA